MYFDVPVLRPYVSPAHCAFTDSCCVVSLAPLAVVSPVCLVLYAIFILFRHLFLLVIVAAKAQEFFGSRAQVCHFNIVPSLDLSKFSNSGKKLDLNPLKFKL